MKVPFVDLAWQEQQICEQRIARFSDIISRTAFIGGKDIEDFELRFAAYCDSRHGIGVANGTDALMIIYDALGLVAGDEVLTIPTTFIASVSPLAKRGIRPVFVDINPITRNFDLSKLEAAVTPRTKAILVVHLYGDMPDMDVITAIADRHDLMIIEDACQAHGALYKGKKAGSFGKAAAFSFYPGKNLGAYGDAGAIVTDDDVVAQRVRMLGNHGGVKKYEHSLLGYNSRLDTLQAAVLDEKLKRLDEWNDMRRVIALRYQDGLGDIQALRLPDISRDTMPVHHLFVIEILEGDRDTFVSVMKERGIGTGIHYPHPLHLTEALGGLGYKFGDFPIAELLASRMVSLPIFPGMSDAQADNVIAEVRSFFL